MQILKKFWRIVFFDTLAIFFLVASALTGWLPGPGGIPLFLIGLSLLAVNHEWANRYIVLTKKYANNLSDIIFKERFRVHFDVIAAILLILSVSLIWKHTEPWVTSIGISLLFMSITIFLSNRNRYRKIKAKLKRKSQT